jgi:hypothetical protein
MSHLRRESDADVGVMAALMNLGAIDGHPGRRGDSESHSVALNLDDADADVAAGDDLFSDPSAVN